MALEVKVPSLGESITSGILAAWRVAEGDYVQSGQAIYDLETDKITSEGMAESAGIISLSVSEGDEVEIGQVIATIDTDATAPKDTDGGKAPQKKESAESSSTEDTPQNEDPASEEADSKEDSKDSPAKPSAGLPQSPAVKAIAARTGLDPETVPGSGKGGRVTKADMLAASKDSPPPDNQGQTNKTETPAPAAKPATPAPVSSPTTAKQTTGERVTRQKMTPLRKRVAERLVTAQQTAAILTTFNEVDMSAVMELRKTHQPNFVDRHGVKLGFMSFFVKAAVHALRAVPQINAQIEGDEILQNHYYDIGVAVSTPRGLMVPVIRDADQLSFSGIEQSILNYGQKAKEGKIAIDDLQGGVFTITNGGIFGSLLSTPILNQPQSGILGMHTIKERPVAVNGQVVIRPMMYLALSYDHRLVDGREAVTFLIKVKEAIEDPTRLMLDL